MVIEPLFEVVGDITFSRSIDLEGGYCVVFKGRRRSKPGIPAHSPSKLSRMNPAYTRLRTRRHWSSFGDQSRTMCPPNGGLPRKEVIQPHLPVRLPCYDFTPVTSPTFDGFLPYGLDHRLRVLLTPVV
jgi:hypothetical protein